MGSERVPLIQVSARCQTLGGYAVIPFVGMGVVRLVGEHRVVGETEAHASRESADV